MTELLDKGEVQLIVRFGLICLIPLIISGCPPDKGSLDESAQIRKSTWKEHRASPIIVQGPAGAWNESRADTGGSLLYFQRRWHLYHSGEDVAGVNRMGVHLSAGENLAGPWLAAKENPLLGPGLPQTWDDMQVAHPSVFTYRGELWMYYGGFDGITWRIGLAKSRDGVTWQKTAGNPVFGPGKNGAWDAAGVGHPSVIYDGSRFVLAFRGWAEGDVDIHSRIGIATSADGLKWTRLPGNPVLGYGRSGKWDAYGLLTPRLWVEAGKYYLNYSGKDAQTRMSSIGHAYAADLGTWTKSSNNPMIDHTKIRYHEVEWATPMKLEQNWFLFATAYFDGGVTTLWEESHQ